MQNMSSSQASSECCYRIFVGGLSYEVDNHRLKESFQGFGNLKKTLIIRDQHTGQSRGYGFVTFATKDSFQAALKYPIYINSRKADCHPVLTKGALKEQENKDYVNKVFVGGVSQTTVAEDLRKYFVKFGRIRESRILYDGKSAKSRGFGFILFEDSYSVDKVFSIPEHKIKSKIVEVKRFGKDSNYYADLFYPDNTLPATDQSSSSKPDNQPNLYTSAPQTDSQSRTKPKRNKKKKASTSQEASQPPLCEKTQLGSQSTFSGGRQSPTNEPIQQEEYFGEQELQVEQHYQDWATNDSNNWTQQEQPIRSSDDWRSAEQAKVDRFSIGGFYSKTDYYQGLGGFGMASSAVRLEPAYQSYFHNYHEPQDTYVQAYNTNNSTFIKTTAYENQWHPSPSRLHGGWGSSIPVSQQSSLY